MPANSKAKNRKKSASKKGLISKLTQLKPKQQKVVLATLVVFAVSMVGYFGFVRSSADAFTDYYKINVSSELGCKLAGREWKANQSKCKDKCRHDNATLKYTANPVRGYCDGYVTIQMAASKCVNDLHRYFIKDVGCSKRANQENTNDSPQCIPGYPNYRADGQTDKCIANEIPGAPTGGGAGQVGPPKDVLHGGTVPTPVTAPSTANTGGGGAPGSNNAPGSGAQGNPVVNAPTTETADKCRLLGRKWDNKKKTCTQNCQADAGALKTGKQTGVKYCGKAVSDNPRMTEDTCVNKRHRVWLVEGCARRADQVDTKNAIQCQPGFGYYNANYKVHIDRVLDEESTIDYCELSESVAKANELAGTPGDTDTPPTTVPQNDDSSPTNPFDLVITTTVAQSLDTSLSQENCYLRGRTWVPAGKDVSGKKFKAGCSREECIKRNNQVRQHNNVQYCEGYVNRNMGQQKCADLQRKWLKDVQGCATRPNQKRTKPVIDAEQCKKATPVYVYHTQDQGADECITKSNLQRLETLASSTGKSVATLTSLPRARLCELKDKVWRDGECKAKVVVVSATSGGTYQKMHYVAVGDSFTADPFRDTIIDLACQRSDHNYPHLIANKLGNVKLDDMSCGCAMTANFTVAQTHCGVNKPPQFSRMNEQTDLITIRTGYNDGPLGVINCYTYYEKDPKGSECSDKFRAEGFPLGGKFYSQEQMISKVRGELEGALKEMKKRSPNAKIIFVGYSRLYPDSGTCAELHIPAGDVSYGKEMMDALNTMQKRVTKKMNVTFVDMYSLSKGHDICSKRPWVAGITSTPGIAAAYHPYPAEMNAAASAVVQLLR